MTEKTRILIADDHPLVLGALRQALSGAIEGAEFFEAADLDSLSAALDKTPDMDLVLLDLSTPSESGALVRRLSSLTPQQVRVLMMLSEGLLNKQIAYELSVSEATIKAHVSAILQKLDVESRTQAVIAAANIEKGQWPAKAP